MKKIITVIFIILIAFNTACNRKNNIEEKIQVTINGDIQESIVSLDYTEFKKEDFNDNEGIKKTGVKLSDILDETKLLKPEKENYIMITAKDGISVVIEGDTANLCYIVEDSNVLSVEAPNHPRVAGIKDIDDITIISKNGTGEGLKIVGDEEKVISIGNTKLLMFEKISENKKNGNTAHKYVKKDVQALDLIEKEGYLYFNNGDIVKIEEDDKGSLVWQNGGISYIYGDKFYQMLTGVLSGVNSIIYDSFYEMKKAIDNNEKVILFLTDGLSYEQAEYYKDSLSLLSSGYVKCASINPAISNVALASIVTGYPPFYTNIFKREIKAPAKEDIFSYVESKGKKSIYIEGNGTLIITSIDPVLNIADKKGYTDNNVYLSAKKALKESPDLLFVHFHGIDDTNHKYSPLSEQAKEIIIEVEGYIEDLIKDFKGTVIIVSDHGAVTIVSEENVKTGIHGVFKNEDMFVPLYVFKRG